MMHFKPEYEIVHQQIESRLAVIRNSLYRDRRPIDGWKTAVVGPGRGVEPQPDNGWKPYTPGTVWGGNDVTQWFRASVIVPDEWTGERVFALLKPGGESLCYIDGVPRQGLDDNRSHVLLRESAAGGERIDIMIDAQANADLQFSIAEVGVQDSAAWDLYFDVRVALDASLAHAPESQIGRGLFCLCRETLKQIDMNVVEESTVYRRQIKGAAEYFRKHIGEFKHSHNEGAFTVMGQSHIDTAWLWPIRVTQKKLARTFSTVLQYMDQYPEFTFIMSQPQLYEYVKEYYPLIWSRLKEKVKTGQWEVSGAPWVEQDLNVPSGESHVRQYLYGNRFFRSEFGIHSQLVWMPDCFGYTFSLPQIMKKSQIDYFFTTKLHSNEYNRHPFDLFRWRGIDGSEVLAIQAPNQCNDTPTPERLKHSWKMFRQKSAAADMPYAFGYGDGGGGPTVEQIEYVHRLRNMSGVPRLSWGKVEETYGRLEESADWDRLPVFHDEMYYEKHRGCQTSQARTKRNNRKSEILARDTEFLASLAFLQGTGYRQEDINAAWKLILLNQFHDILPGSSINEVYLDADRDYAAVFTKLHDVRNRALQTLTDVVDTSGEGRAIVVYNTLGWSRSDVAAIDAADLPNGRVSVLDGDGNAVPSQRVMNPDGSESLLFEAKDLPPLGHAVFRLVDGELSGEKTVDETDPCVPMASAVKLENDFFELRFGRDGSITKLYDKRCDRDVLADNARGNELILFEDRPAANDAWDIDFNVFEVFQSCKLDGSIDVIENGPVRATVRVIRKSAKSTVTQDISVWRTIERIDFATRIDWREKHRLLKAAFPVNVTSRRATFEIAYGAIERPTHRSTQWDAARFEVPAHRWIDLSEAGYGVSLLNDCKYGFDVFNNCMRISLLRAPTSPDPECDEGRHEVVYSLYPHADSWQEAGTVRRAYELNVPLHAAVAEAHDGPLPPSYSFAATDSPNVIIDCVKKAEDSDDLIVRLYEAHGARRPVRLFFNPSPSQVSECDLMEENDRMVGLDGNAVSFNVRPWEIRTFKVRF